jgi:hypothetical protein
MYYEFAQNNSARRNAQGEMRANCARETRTRIAQLHWTGVTMKGMARSGPAKPTLGRYGVPVAATVYARAIVRSDPATGRRSLAAARERRISGGCFGLVFLLIYGGLTYSFWASV